MLYKNDNYKILEKTQSISCKLNCKNLFQYYKIFYSIHFACLFVLTILTAHITNNLENENFNYKSFFIYVPINVMLG